jgi:poly(3-hydroxybutyrate) depolymerase
MHTLSFNRVSYCLLALAAIIPSCSSADPAPNVASSPGGGSSISKDGTAGSAEMVTVGSGGTTTSGGSGGTGGDSVTSGAGGTGGAGTGTGGRGNGGESGSGVDGGTTRGDAGASAGVIKSMGCGAASWPASKAGNTINVSGMNRSYILRIPDNYDTNHPYRLIVAFHWLNGTADNVANGNNWATAKPFYGLWDLANGSTIFVAPQGINNGWSDSGRTNTSGGQDIALTRALIDHLESQLCIDKSRIFAEGFSMGGSMSYAVACAMGDVVRAVAVHSGGPMSGCVQHNKPVPYFMTHGIKDSVCTYPQFGVPQLDDFAKLDGCMMPTLPSPTGNTPSCIDFQGCSAGDPVRSCLFVGDHTPSPPSTSSTWVPAETWKFLSQF